MVQLVVDPDSVSKSIKLADQQMSYRRLSKRLDFDFECDLPRVAEALAENLKKNPELIVKKWKMVMECCGLVLGTGGNSLNITINGRPDGAPIGLSTYLLFPMEMSRRVMIHLFKVTIIECT